METYKVDKEQVIAFLKDADAILGKKGENISIYCVGGTFLILDDVRELSKDIDFTVSPIEYRIFEEVVNQIKRKYDFSIDCFHDGWLPNCHLAPDFYDKAKEVLKGKFKNIKVYLISNIDLVISKILSNRDRDIIDAIDVLDKDKIPKEDLVERFGKTDIRFSGKEREYRGLFNTFIEDYYGKDR